ncbi:hypothetical protein Tco_0432806 [Tanacetum coccineum]
MSSSTVTYTSVYTDSEPWRFQWVSDDELEAPQSPGQAPPSLDYVPTPDHPPSPDYVSGLEEPEQAQLSPNYDQPLLDDASPTALSPGYVTDSDPEEDLEEDPADGGDDDDDESSDDDDDDDDDEEQEASEDDDEEEEEHLAPADSSLYLSRRARRSVRPQTPMSATAEALITEYASAPTPSSLTPSPLTPLSSPLPQIPSSPLPLPSLPTNSLTYNEAPLGYKAARIRLRAASPSTYHPSEIPSPPLLLPSTAHRDDIPKADMPLWKRAHFTTPTGRFEVGESLAATTARQPGLDVAIMDATPGCPMSREVGYGIEDVWDDMVGDMEERASTTIEGLSQRVTDLSTTLSRDTHEIYLTAALGRIQTLEAREPARTDDPEDAGSSS